MSSAERCPICGATYPVVMKNHCGACAMPAMKAGSFANPSVFGKPAFTRETPPMSPHQKPQEDVVEVSETAVGAIESLTRRVVFAEPTVLTNEHIAAFSTGQPVPGAVDEPKLIGALMGADDGYARGYEAGRRDMREEAGWQPIETAPKDGKDGVVGVWVMDDRGPQHAFWSAWTVVFEGIGLGVDGTWGDTPTHWRYAPEPPALPTEPLGGEG